MEGEHGAPQQAVLCVVRLEEAPSVREAQADAGERAAERADHEPEQVGELEIRRAVGPAGSGGGVGGVWLCRVEEHNVESERIDGGEAQERAERRTRRRRR